MISIGIFKTFDANIEMTSYSGPKRDYTVEGKDFFLGIFGPLFGKIAILRVL